MITYECILCGFIYNASRFFFMPLCKLVLFIYSCFLIKESKFILLGDMHLSNSFCNCLLHKNSGVCAMCTCFSSFKLVQSRGNRKSFNNLQEGKIIIVLPVLKDRFKKIITFLLLLMRDTSLKCCLIKNPSIFCVSVFTSLNHATKQTLNGR